LHVVSDPTLEDWAGSQYPEVKGKQLLGSNRMLSPTNSKKNNFDVITPISGTPLLP